MRIFEWLLAFFSRAPESVRVLQVLDGSGELTALEMRKVDPSLGRNSIYVTIGQLLDQGLVTSRDMYEYEMPASAAGIESPDTPRQRLVCITEDGHRYLDAYARGSLEEAYLGM